MSWEALTMLSAAYARRDAEKMLMLMVAAQGDADSWGRLQKDLLKVLKNEPD